MYVCFEWNTRKKEEWNHGTTNLPATSDWEQRSRLTESFIVVAQVIINALVIFIKTLRYFIMLWVRAHIHFSSSRLFSISCPRARNKNKWNISVLYYYCHCRTQRKNGQPLSMSGFCSVRKIHERRKKTATTEFTLTPCIYFIWHLLELCFFNFNFYPFNIFIPPYSFFWLLVRFSLWVF